MGRSARSACLAWAVLGTSLNALGTPRSFVGTGATSDWIDANVWSPAGVPTNVDALTLSSVATRTLAVGSDAAASSAVLDGNLVLAIAPAATLSLGTFEFKGGMVSGLVSTQTLRIASGISGSGSYLLGATNNGPSSVTFSAPTGITNGGDVLVGMNVTVRVPTNVTSFFVSTPAALTNNGTLTFEAAPRSTINFINVSATNFTNAGLLNLLAGSSATAADANRRTFNGSFTNTAAGTVNVAPSVLMEVTGGALTNSGAFNLSGSLAPSTFIQQAGTLSVPPTTGKLSASTFELRGGTVFGLVNTQTLRIASGITGSGTYLLGGTTNGPSSVTLGVPASATTGGDILAGMNVTARVPTTISSFFVSTSGNLTNNGTLTLEAAARSTSGSLTVASSNFTNTGTLNVLGGSSAIAFDANRRTFNGSFTNAPAGTVNVATGVFMEATSGSVTNTGTFNLNGLLSASTFVQQSGSLTVGPVGGLINSNIFELRGGTVAGLVNTQTLRIASGIAGSGSYLLGGTTNGSSSASIGVPSNASAGGDILAGMNVTVRVPTNVSSFFLGTQGTFTNNGTLTLDAVATSSSASINVSSSYVINAGVLNVSGGSSAATPNANLRRFGGSVTNQIGATINIASGVSMGAAGAVTNSGNVTVDGSLTSSLFEQQAGALTIGALASLTPSVFELRGGTVSGIVTTRILRIGTGFTGSGSYVLGGNVTGSSDATIAAPPSSPSGSGDILAGMTVTARVPAAFPSLFVSTPVLFSNNGVMTLEAAPHVSPASITVSSSTFTNAGVLNVLGGSSATTSDANRRTFNGSITNTTKGTINIAQNVLLETLGGTFSNAGMVNLNGTLHASTFIQQDGGLAIGATGSMVSSIFELRGGMVTGLVNSQTLRIGTGFPGSGTYLLGGNAGGPSSVVIGVPSSGGAGGNILAGMNVTVRVPTTVGSFSVSTPSVFTNEGTLTFESTDRTTAGTIVVQSSAFINNGVVNLLGGSSADNGNQRIFAGSFTNRAGATLNIAPNVQFLPGGPFVNNGRLKTGDGGVVRFQALPTNNGELRIQRALLIDYSGSSPLAQALAQITATTGGRIVADAPDLRIGYAEASTLPGAPTTFLGQPVDATTLVLRATIGGDTNLSGTVDFDDLLALARSYNQTGAAWINGDSDYDGAVGFSDLLLLAKSYGKSLPAAGEAAFFTAGDLRVAFASDYALAISLVPEPSTAAVTVAGLGALFFRHRRRSKH